MKRNFLTAILLLSGLVIYAQPQKDKVYAFQQQVIPGAKAAGDIDETGALIKKEKPNAVHYLIYLTTFSKTKLYPVQLWINGEAFSVKAEPVTHIPVLETNTDAPAAKVKPLFPDKGAKVLLLTPLPLTIDKSNRQAKALATKNAVVVLYKSAGKLQYGVLKKFTALEPEARQ